MKPSSLILPVLLILAGCAAHVTATRSDSTVADVQALLQGRFDNREQVAQMQAKPNVEDAPVPHVIIAIEPTARVDWSLWHVHLDLDAETSTDATWAMQTRVEYDGSKALIPYYQYKPVAPPVAQGFDPRSWLSLEACALRGDFSKARIQGTAESYEPCVAEVTGIGPRRALLPAAIEREGERLRIILAIAGSRTGIEAQQVQ